MAQVHGILSDVATDRIHLIDDGRAIFGVDLAFWLPQILARHPSQARHIPLVPPTSEVDDGAPLPARVNHGRWIVDCPDCRGAMPVWVEQPLMWCSDCQNRAVGHRWRRVALPVVEERVAIEAILSQRPNPANRNWEPGEAVADLIAENAAHAGEG